MANVQMSLMLVLWLWSVACVVSTTWTDHSSSSKHQTKIQTNRQASRDDARGIIDTVTDIQDSDASGTRRRRDSDAADFRELERERIAELRSRRKQESRAGKSLFGQTNDVGERLVTQESQKSKRIGKVVIKLRNGKKLVVKKRRKLNNEFIKPTTQKPVLVTVKSSGSKLQKKTKIRQNNFNAFNTVSARPSTHIFEADKDDEIRVFSLGDSRQNKERFRTTTPPPISFITTPAVPSKHNFPAIVVTPRSEEGIRSSSQIFESNRVVDTEDDSDEELDYYDYYDSSDDVTNTDDEVFRSQDPVRPDPAFSSSTFPPPEDRFADIDQNDLNSFSNFPTTPRPALPASPRQQQQQQSTAGGESLGLSLDELRRELQQQQNNQLRSGAPVKGERVTIGLKSHAQPKHSPPLSSPTPAVPTPSLSSSSPFSENLQRTQSSSSGFTAFDDSLIQRSQFGARKTIPARFQVNSAVPAPSPVPARVASTTQSSVDRFQTAFTTTSAPASFPQRLQTTPRQRFQSQPADPNRFLTQTNNRFQPTLVQVQKTSSRPDNNNAILPDITPPTRLPPTRPAPTRLPPSSFSLSNSEDLQTNSVAQQPVREQLRSQNIFNDNAASVETSSQPRFNNINQNQAQRPVISPQQQFNSEQTVKSFRNFKFESLGSRFSSAQAPSDQFYFGPPSQTINMRDGSYTIITVLS